MFNEAYSVGMMAGPILGGLLADALGLRQALLVVSVLVLAGLPMLLGRRRA